jgi:vitamin B12/bleomycin/antimicrobial peptide transport system ATP-binding/permease protein
VNNIRATLAIVWRIAAPYFRSEDKWAGRGLLAAVVAIELSLVAIDVLVNQWNNRFYNALQEHDWTSFVHEILVFCTLATANVVLAVYQLYLNQWLQIRWRQWMTRGYLRDWLHDANHYRMQLQGDAADNPDQRMTDDVRLFIDRTIDLGLKLLNAVVTLTSFVVILWGLSAAAHLNFFGTHFAIPGYLVWCALIYAVVGTVFTQWIGSPLVHLDFNQQRYEADFRFNLVRIRENSEQIALLRGEGAERERLATRFGRVVANWYGIMSRTKRLVFFTASFDQTAVIVPYILVAPAYFADRIQLGGMMQSASAFGSVQKALSYFVTVYRDMAEWRAVVARLDGFEKAIATAEALPRKPPAIGIVTADGSDSIDLAELMVSLPNGTPQVTAERFSISSNERILVTGPSGAGKSTLFRAIAGIWPFGSGVVTVPANATLMMLPQWPYLPIGTLKAAIAYPAPDAAFGEARIAEVLRAVGLPKLEPRLDQDEHWNRVLSLGEQQRLGLARALLHAPQFLFLDEATASLDEASEAKLYRLIVERLPETTLVSIGHRSTLQAFHERNAVLAPDGDKFALGDSDSGLKASVAASAGGAASGARYRQTE